MDHPIERLSDAVETLEWLASQAEELPDSKELVQMLRALALARSYVAAYVAHRENGSGPAVAIVATVSHEHPIDLA